MADGNFTADHVQKSGSADDPEVSKGGYTVDPPKYNKHLNTYKSVQQVIEFLCTT